MARKPMSGHRPRSIHRHEREAVRLGAFDWLASHGPPPPAPYDDDGRPGPSVAELERRAVEALAESRRRRLHRDRIRQRTVRAGIVIVAALPFVLAGRDWPL